MNLIIDIGTSFIKVAVFKENEILFKEVIQDISTGYIDELKQKFPEIKYSILSSVRKKDPGFSSFLNSEFECSIELQHNTPIPIGNVYKSPDTLGYDRLAAAVGAYTIYPDANVLIIDIGTAITVDFINQENQYLGGNISPGLEMRFKALSDYTMNLPKENPSEQFDLLGKDTSGAIIGGVQNGIIFELQGYINEMNKQFRNLKVIVTGGNVGFFDKKLKSSIFVDLNLTLKGLNRILAYNVER